MSHRRYWIQPCIESQILFKSQGFEGLNSIHPVPLHPVPLFHVQIFLQKVIVCVKCWGIVTGPLHIKPHKGITQLNQLVIWWCYTQLVQRRITKVNSYCPITRQRNSLIRFLRLSVSLCVVCRRWSRHSSIISRQKEPVIFGSRSEIIALKSPQSLTASESNSSSVNDGVSTVFEVRIPALFDVYVSFVP